MAPTLTASAQQFTRSLLTLTWPGIAAATVQRLDPDGTWRNVRNAEPIVCLGSCAFYDHEAPLDQPLTYRATSAQGTGAINTNIYFEAGVANWTGANGATLASSGTQKHEGTLALRVTPNGATANTQAMAEEDAVVVGTTYGATAWLWSTSAFTWQVGISWYTAAHGLISQSLQALALGATTWTNISTSAAAPATAAFGRLTVQASGTPAGANLLYVDEAMLTSPAALTVTSSQVTMPSGGQVWLTDPGWPAYAAPVVVNDLSESYPQRRGVFQAIGAALPVAVSDVRGGAAGTLTIQTNSTADTTRLRAMLGTGRTLLLRLPATWGPDTWYLSVDTTGVDRFTKVATDNWRRWTLPFTRVDRPTGTSAGAVGQTWNDVVATYATWNALIAAKATWTALNQSVT